MKIIVCHILEKFLMDFTHTIIYYFWKKIIENWKKFTIFLIYDKNFSKMD